MNFIRYKDQPPVNLSMIHLITLDRAQGLRNDIYIPIYRICFYTAADNYDEAKWEFENGQERDEVYIKILDDFTTDLEKP